MTRYESKEKVMLARETRIYKDAQSLTKETFMVTRKMKTEYRASIARRMEDCAADLSSRIVEANVCAPNSAEREHVLGHDFIVTYERMFFFLSIAADLRLISFKQHAALSRILDSIGRQAAGWRRSVLAKGK